jgi:hypothetical protein
VSQVKDDSSEETAKDEGKASSSHQAVEATGAEPAKGEGEKYF